MSSNRYSAPKRFLTKELRQIPRHDLRKEQLKNDIKESLAASKNYSEFENKIKRKGYEIFKARGIAFRDKQQVYTKGSEVGYSLQTIQKILALKPELKQVLLEQKDQQERQNTKERIKEENRELLMPKTGEQKQELNFNRTKEIKPQIKKAKHHAEH